MKNFKNAFTMIELIFVIVIMGILAAVAIPKFGESKSNADVAKGRSEVASIRAGIINERQGRIIKGDSAWITKANLDTDGLFGGVLMYPLTNENSDGNWYTATTGDGSYKYITAGVSVVFSYDNTTGKFTCDVDHDTYGTQCESLVE